MGSFLPFETLRKEKDAGATSAGFRWIDSALHKLQKGNWDGNDGANSAKEYASH